MLTDAALSQPYVRAFMLAYLDIAGDPLRAVLAPHSIRVPAGMTGDDDIDGHLFDALDPRLVDVGPVEHGEGGTEQLTVSLSGTIALDSDLLNLLADPANFRGREAKLFIGLLSGATPVEMRGHYAGYMSVPVIEGEADSQTISLAIENYLDLFTGGRPARTLLSQRAYDPDDASGDATAGAANAQAVHGGGGIAQNSARQTIRDMF